MVHRLGELSKLFLKLGTISFGGPAAHLAIMEQEVVERRGWLTRQQFLDLIGVTHLIPGPNAVEMASHVGFRRAGLLGSLVAGMSFTLPAVVITGVLAASYYRYGTLPQIEPFLAGIKPAVLAVIFIAVWRLGKGTLARWQQGLISLSVAAAALLGADEVIALLAGGLIGAVFLRFWRPRADPKGKAATGLLVGLSWWYAAREAPAVPIAAVGAGAGAASTAAVPLWKLGLFFLKVGAVMYGGGYVLVAYLEGGLVGHYGWLTEKQLLDAVAIGQLTPGPLLTTATFVGYVVSADSGLFAGISGALVATVCILLPSFFFVAAVNPLVPKLRNSYWASLFLDAVNAASLGLIVAVALKLTRSTLVDWQSWLIAVSAAGLALRWKLPPAWLVVAGALAGRLLLLLAS